MSTKAPIAQETPADSPRSVSYQPDSEPSYPSSEEHTTNLLRNVVESSSAVQSEDGLSHTASSDTEKSEQPLSLAVNIPAGSDLGSLDGILGGITSASPRGSSSISVSSRVPLREKDSADFTEPNDLRSGSLLYKNIGGSFASVRTWKECYCILTNDAFQVFNRSGDTTPIVSISLAEVLEVKRAQPGSLPTVVRSRTTSLSFGSLRSLSPLGTVGKKKPWTLAPFRIHVASSKHVYEFKSTTEEMSDQWIANIRCAAWEAAPRHRRVKTAPMLPAAKIRIARKLKGGWLYQKGSGGFLGMEKWHRRFCIVGTEGIGLYMDSSGTEKQQTDSIAFDQIISVVPLEDVNEKAKSPLMRFLVHVSQSSQVYEFRAPSHKLCEQWIGKLQQVCEGPL